MPTDTQVLAPVGGRGFGYAELASSRRLERVASRQAGGSADVAPWKIPRTLPEFGRPSQLCMVGEVVGTAGCNNR